MEFLKINGVIKEYTGHRALDNVSLTIPKGGIYGLLGPNGAGKTSLIRIITQITQADEGEILFLGERLAKNHITRVGYLPEERGLYKKMKVGEQLLYIAQLKDLNKKEAQEKIDYWLSRFDIADWKDKFIDELSKGMQQKIQFIATVVNQPELLILDEPFSGFDPINANLIKDEILELNKAGVTIIFSTHRMESVEELCTHIGLINKSEVVLEGEIGEIKRRYKSGHLEVVCEGQLQESESYEIIENSTHQQGLRFVLKPDLNDYSFKNITEVITNNSDKVYSVREIYPSVNDIFLKLVEGT